MINFRIVPCLLLRQGGLAKSTRFKRTRYVGDPINTIRLFNDMGVDEIVFLDIEASVRKVEPDYCFIENIASECFMPLAYGGGINTIEQAKRIIASGVEKVIVNSAAVLNPAFIEGLANAIGSQSVCICIDYKTNFFGKQQIAYLHGKRKQPIDPLDFALKMEKAGAGEIILQSIDRDGTRSGYDLETIKTVTDQLDIPVVALGGANTKEDMIAARKAGANAAGAGSQFVFVGAHQAVLVNYPNEEQLAEIRGEQKNSIVPLRP